MKALRFDVQKQLVSCFLKGKLSDAPKKYPFLFSPFYNNEKKKCLKTVPPTQARAKQAGVLGAPDRSSNKLAFN